MATPFAARLRELDKAATPGPFLWDEPENWHGLSARVATAKYEPVAQVVVSGWPKRQAQSTAALLVLLRNSAARLAAVVEAAGIALIALDVDPENHPPQWSKEDAHARLRTALVALEAP